MARTSISDRWVLLGLALLALLGCSKAAPVVDAGLPDSTFTPLPHVMAAGSPAYPYTINGLDAGIAPHLFLGQCDAGLVWANGGPGSDGGCVAAGGGGGSSFDAGIPQALFVNVNSGSNANSCTQQAPCQTLAHATTVAESFSPTMATAVNIYASPGTYAENVVCYPGVNYIGQAPIGAQDNVQFGAGTDGGGYTVSANVAAFSASTDVAPTCGIVNVWINSALAVDVHAATGGAAYIVLVNSSLNFPGTDVFTGGNTYNSALITAGGYFLDNTLTVTNASLQTFSTPFYSTYLNVESTHAYVSVQLFGSPVGGVAQSTSVSLATEGPDGGSGNVVWQSMGSPFGASVLAEHGPGVAFATTDPLPSDITTTAGAVYPTVAGLWPVQNLGGCTVGSQIAGFNAFGTAGECWTVSGDSTAVAAGVWTNVGLNGKALPPLDAGYLYYSGSAWEFNSGSTTSVTGTGLWYSASGTLGSAAVTLSQDVTPSALASNNLPITVTQLQDGEVTCGASTGTLTCATGATKCGLSQTGTTGATPTTMWIAAQASSNGNANGSIVDVDLGALAGSGTPGFFIVTEAGGANQIFGVGRNPNAHQVGLMSTDPSYPAPGNYGWAQYSGNIIMNAQFGGTIARSVNGSTRETLASTGDSFTSCPIITDGASYLSLGDYIDWQAGATWLEEQDPPASVASGNGTAGTLKTTLSQAGGATTAVNTFGGTGASALNVAGVGGDAFAATATAGNGGVYGTYGGVAGGYDAGAGSGNPGVNGWWATGYSDGGAAGTVTLATIGNVGLGLPPATVALGGDAGSTYTFTVPQYAYPHIAITGTQTSALTLVYPASIQGCWFTDFSGLTVTTTVSVKASGGSPLALGGITSGLNDMVIVCVAGGTTITAIQ